MTRLLTDLTDDPFSMDEPDPAKCKALESSLWELKVSFFLLLFCVKFFPKIPANTDHTTYLYQYRAGEGNGFAMFQPYTKGWIQDLGKDGGIIQLTVKY